MLLPDKNNFETFTSERLIIKSAADSFAGEILDFYKRNKDYFEPFENEHPDNYYTLDFQRKYIEFQRIEAHRVRAFRYYTFEKSAPNRIVSTLSLMNVTLGCYKSAVIGYKTDLKSVKNGLTAEAISAVIDYNCKTRGLHRIEAYIEETNTESIKTALSCGFTPEGIAKEYLFKNNCYHDMLRYVYIHKQDPQMQQT